MDPELDFNVEELRHILSDLKVSSSKKYKQTCLELMQDAVAGLHRSINTEEDSSSSDSITPVESGNPSTPASDPVLTSDKEPVVTVPVSVVAYKTPKEEAVERGFDKGKKVLVLAGTRNDNYAGNEAWIYGHAGDGPSVWCCLHKPPFEGVKDKHFKRSIDYLKLV